ncbi:MAG TPA: hypothetical protein VIH52_01100 [Candidatus Nanoarchaeia archaeon]|nr:hypothetical protein [uncultured archaeon]
MSKELLLDTTVAKEAKVEIKEDGKVLVTITKDSPLAAIEAALKKAGLKLKEIDSFSAKVGPGSYTGIRVGLAVTHALNFALGRKAKALEPKYQ